jgi:outer membrane protein TolC
MEPRYCSAAALKFGIAAIALGLLGGCAKFSPDGGMGVVADHVSAEIGRNAVKIASPSEASAAKRRVEVILSKPLTADAAVQVALLNNRGLQAEYNTLGIAEADFVEASLPPNPTVSFERISAPGDLETERRVVANILALFLLPARRDIAMMGYEAARFRAIEATFRLAAETRRAYYRVVAASQTVRFLEQAQIAADAAAALTRKLGETGAATKLDQARAGAFHAEISNQLAQARMRAGSEREALTRLLGVWGSGIDYKLPSALPNLPVKLPSSGEIEATAIRKRVDLIAARLELDRLARSLGLTRANRFVSVLELSGISARRRSDAENARPIGFELAIEIPIFDLGEVKVRRARETYMQAVNRLIQRAVDARSDVRSAYQTLRGTYDISRAYRTQILPLRKIISEQALLAYNGMLIDVFDLLTTSRESIVATIAAIAAKRDYFIAMVDFQAATIGGGGPVAVAGEETVASNEPETGSH